MPYSRRKYAPKRRLVRRRRLARPMRRRAPLQPVHYFKRSVYYSGFTSNSIANDVFGSQLFLLNQVSGFNEFQQLYDQYKILNIKWSLIPRGNSSDITSTVAGNSAGSVGVFSVIDYDDIAPATLLSQLMEYRSLKMTRSHQFHIRTLKPKTQVQMLNTSGLSTSAGVNNTQWIDANQSTIPHYGLKYCLQQAPAIVQQFDLKVDYSLAFRNVR